MRKIIFTVTLALLALLFSGTAVAGVKQKYRHVSLPTVSCTYTVRNNCFYDGSAEYFGPYSFWMRDHKRHYLDRMAVLSRRGYFHRTDVVDGSGQHSNCWQKNFKTYTRIVCEDGFSYESMHTK